MRTLLFLILFALAHAQKPTAPPSTPRQPTTVISSSLTSNANSSDVYLLVPTLSVERVELNASLIDAHVRFSVSLGSLFVVQGSTDVLLKDLSLSVSNVNTQLEMSVRLERVQAMFSRLMDSLDANPDLLPNLLRSISNLLSSTIDELGHIVQRSVESNGNIIARTYDGSAGNLLTMSVERPVAELAEIASHATVTGVTRLYMDAESARVIEVQYDLSGNLVTARVLQ